MSTTPSTPARTRDNQNAATTPYRKSMADLMDQLSDLFDSLPTSISSSSDRSDSPLPPDSSSSSVSDAHLNSRTRPLRLIPDLLAAFEHKRGIDILSSTERDQLTAMVANASEETREHPVGVDEVLTLLVSLGISGSDTPKQPSQDSRQTEVPTTDMLPADSYPRPSDGSPVPRHRRTTSSASTSSFNSTTRPLTPTSSSSRPSTPLARPALIPASSPAARRRSLMSSLSRTSSLNSPVNGGKTLKKKRTFDDLANLIVQQGGKYLGVGLDGATGHDWSAGDSALRAKAALSTKGPNRDRDLGLLLTPLTYPQLKSLNESYRSHFGKTFLDALSQDKSFKGTVEFVVQGLVVGPLAWDVHLLQLALDAEKVHDTLLIELLVGRSPSSLAVLRAAYSSRASINPLSTHSSSSTASPAPSATSKSLDVAVLSAFSSGQLRLRKAWEVALQGRWEDLPNASDYSDDEDQLAKEPGAEERRKRLIKEDLDQLKVGLRRGGNTELVSKILLARSPYHLGDLDQEYRKSTAGHSSLSKAIKQTVGAGVLQKMLLHVVEGGKRRGKASKEGTRFEITVWRDAKKLETAFEKFANAGDVKGRDGEKAREDARSEVGWRLARLHWDRPRSLAVQTAYDSKYSQSIVSRLNSVLPLSALREILASLVNSAALPEPVVTSEDQDRLATSQSGTTAAIDQADGRLSIEEATSSASSESEAEPIPIRMKGYESGHSQQTTSGSEVEAGELEAEGEMSDPPSPRSPPPPSLEDDFEFDLSDHDDNDATPNTSAISTFDSQSDFSRSSDRALSPLPRSASSMSFNGDLRGAGDHPVQRRSSSSLSNRPRIGGLINSHRPPSSASGSTGDRSISSLRHSRPIAPSRAKRRQSEEASNRDRSASTEPQSPTDTHAFAARSPTPSGRARSSLGRSTSSGSVSLQDSSMAMGSPGVDETSFHPAPLSPVGDVGPSSSSFASAFPGFSPSPVSSHHMDLSGSSDLFSTAGDSPNDSQRYFSLRRQSSIDDSEESPSINRKIFGHSRDSGSIMNSEQVQQLIRHASDLQKKLRDAEGRLQASASAFEQDQSDLEARLEELRAELQSKRKEEKELRNNERQHLGQISSLEGDISKLTKSLERNRENYESMKRNYTETCEEAERLRALVAETRRENRAAEESIQGHALQVQQFERDREMLQQGINKLEQDLDEARKAQDTLDDQKQENLLLKETIDRLRFDLDEMRAANRKSGFIDPSSTGITNSPHKSLQASINRSLGKELASQLAVKEEESESEEEASEGEGEDEIIVTTERRIHQQKKRSKKSGPLSEPVVHHVETTVTVSDADIQTDEISTHETAAQTDLSGVNVDLVIASPPPAPQLELAPPPSKPKTAKERQQEAAKELGIDVEIVKQYLEAQKVTNRRSADNSSSSSPVASSSPRRTAGVRWRSRMLPGSVAQAPNLLISYFPNAARPYVSQVLDSSISFIFYSATIYLVGVLSGAHFLPAYHHHHLAPFSVVFSSHDSTAYNAMSWEGLTPGGSSAGGLAREGLGQFLYELVWNGVRSSRRIPV